MEDIAGDKILKPWAHASKDTFWIKEDGCSL